MRHISPHLPIPPHTSPHLPTSPCTSLDLPHISPGELFGAAIVALLIEITWVTALSALMFVGLKLAGTRRTSPTLPLPLPLTLAPTLPLTLTRS